MISQIVLRRSIMAAATGCIYDSTRGFAIHTWTGKSFYANDIRPEDICVEDIAHGLSMTCRYGGQSDYFYSVAQHSVHCYDMAVSQGLSQEFLKEALLHDAVEAYLGDFPRPWKMAIPLFSEFEHMVEAQLHPILGIPVNKSDEIRFIDETMLATETPLMFQEHGMYKRVDGKFVYSGDDEIIAGLPERLDWVYMGYWEPKAAEEFFLSVWDEISQAKTTGVAA